MALPILVADSGSRAPRLARLRTGVMGEPSHDLRYFSGDDSVDWREYRRWKQWALNKMAVMDKLPEEARGSFIWTLLQGRALEVVEHLKEHEYQKEGGDKVLFELLDKRWPE